MRIQDLQILPKFRDAWSYLYVDNCRIEQQDKAIVVLDANGKVPVPCAAVCLLMLGPGTSVTHAAISALADNGCLVCWGGEEGVRFYAYGQGKTRNADNLLHQASLWADPETRLEVVIRLYQMRFGEAIPDSWDLRQIRGKEGIRVREAYARASKETGVPWTGRSYDRKNWAASDPVNRALSAANSCLYGICQAAILALGLSPAIGFIHTGKMLSFVYDIADLYKTEISIPIAFSEAAEGSEHLETRARKASRDTFRKNMLLKKAVQDILFALGIRGDDRSKGSSGLDTDPALPASLWDPVEGTVESGKNFAEDSEVGEEDGGADS
ncbi:MAG: type I-E CRISPR-associated endonuclease Cas1 [Desulfomonile tiedjei]|uniref:CRISPR-associated endonuclease Cas1 n=1 Tax=Desulfomonile tiedjei TaxID=2358 RepID=A0A9D6UZQ1_9BACT|nr:type I-E CRISPR-associated endonuclease Cas1 [Desulfomonile tiedjei]